MPAQLVLQNRATLSQGFPRIGLWLALAAILPVIGFVALILYLSASGDGKPVDWSALITKLIAKAGEDWFELLGAALAILGAALQILYLAASRHRERLLLDELGISYVSPLPKAVQFIHPSWSLQWSNVRRAEFNTNAYAKRPELISVVFHTGLRKRAIRPYMWVDAANFQPPPWRRQVRIAPPKAEEMVAEVMNSPVMRFVQGRPHIKLAPLSLDRLKPFALERNPVALGFVALFFLSIVYAIVDALILNAETYAGEPFLSVYVAAGLTVGLAAALLLRGAKVPITETVVVAVLTGAAFGAALYPGLLRANQLTDTEGLRTYEYKMIAPANFVPEQEGLPELHFPARHREFWSQYEPGSVQEFELRKGGLGFYQINMKPIYDRIRNYYEQRSR